MKALALIWIAFFMYTSIVGHLHTFMQVPLCLLAAFVYVFTFYPARRGDNSTGPSTLDLILMLMGGGICIYVMTEASEFIFHPNKFTIYDYAISVTLFLLMVEGSRRSLGWTIPLITIFMLFYTIVLGDFLPGRWWFGGVDVAHLFGNRFLRSDMGFWGQLPKLACITMPLFLVFGPMLFTGKGGDVFMNLAQMIGGRIRGGAAQVSVIGSSLFGIISGAAVASAATVGTLTIPTMKQAGFEPEVAAAVESASSTGSQLDPPIMGATAFVMAEFLAVPYIDVALAAWLPSILFYLSIGISVYFFARKYHMEKPPKESLPKFKDFWDPKAVAQVVVPTVILITLLLMNFTAEYAVGWALAVGIVIALTWSDFPFKERIQNLIKGAEDGIRTVAWLLMSLVLLQAATSLIGYSGLGLNLSATIFQVGSESGFLALLLTAIVVLLLGLGLNTTASFVIGYAVVAPTVVKLGFDPFAVSFFIFYYAVLSTITPPTCNTVFACSAIAGSSWIRTANIAMGLALAGFLFPFSWAYNPGLLLAGGALNVVRCFIFAAISVLCLAVTTVGYWMRPVTVIERILFFAAAILLLFPTLGLNMMGLALAALLIAAQFFLGGKPAAA
jgi:TRAP transporter 4TM/12TM fusion protein